MFWDGGDSPIRPVPYKWGIIVPTQAILEWIAICNKNFAKLFSEVIWYDAKKDKKIHVIASLKNPQSIRYIFYAYYCNKGIPLIIVYYADLVSWWLSMVLCFTGFLYCINWEGFIIIIGHYNDAI